MKSIYTYIFTFFFLLTSTLSIAQNADFKEICAGGTVTFSAIAPQSTYYWDFKDFASSTIASPSHIFSTPGVYNVELSTVKGGATVGTVSITVYEKPIITITSDPNTSIKGCSPLNVNLNASTEKPLPNNISGTFNWITGDGTPEFVNQNHLTHIYTTGTYGLTITLNTPSIPSCNTTKVLDNYISVSTKPIVNFSSTPQNPSACVGPINVTSWTNNSSSQQNIPLKYKWDFGNTNTSVDINGSPQTYSADGQYTITLTATDTNNCSANTSNFISLGKPKASFTVNDTVCINTSFNIINTSGSSGTWKIDNGAPQFNLSNYTFNTKGNHTISLSISLNGCSDVVTKNIFVQDPSVQIMSTPTYSCHDTLTSFYSAKLTNDNVSKIKSYNWSFNSPFALPNSTTIANPKCFYNTYDTTYHYRKLNKFPVDLTITTYAGCTAKANIINDTIYEMWARFVPDKHQGCKDLSITFSDSSTSHLKKPIAMWEWDFGDGSPKVITYTKTTPTHTYTTEGIYYPKLYIYDNTNKLLNTTCLDTSYLIEIKVGSKQNISFTASPNSVCPGETINFTNTSSSNVKSKIDAWHYSSNKEKVSHCFQNDSPSLIFNDTVGTHTITLTGEYNGCQSFISQTIDVKGPIADFDYVLDCKTPNLIKLVNKSKNQGITSIVWDLGETTINSLSTDDTISYTYLNPGNKKITMTVTGASGCKNGKDSTYIHIGTIQSNLTLTDVQNNAPIVTNIGSKPIIDGGANYLYDANGANDVYTDCYRGYSFITQKAGRPNTYNIQKDTFQLNSSFDQYVGMVVRNANNCVDTAKQIVRVINTTAQFNITNKITNDVTNQPICLPATIKFDDISTSDTTIVSWDWDFGDNTAHFNGQNPPNHLYKSGSVQNDTVYITLTIKNKAGFTREVKKGIPIYAPLAKITSTPSIDPSDLKIHTCSGNTVNLIANQLKGNNLSYKWTFEDGKNDLTKTPIKKFNITSNSNEKDEVVKLVYTEPYTGCKDSIEQIVNIQRIPIAIIASDKENEKVYCHPFNVTFNDTKCVSPAGTITTWQLTPSVSIDNSTASFSYPKGKQTVTITLTTTNGCKKDTLFPFTVIGPEGKITAEPKTICKGESVNFEGINFIDVTSFTWDFADGKLDSVNKKISHTYYTLEPKLKVQLKMSGNGCIFIDTTSIFIKQVVADFKISEISLAGVDTVICPGDAMKYDNTSTNADIFKWDLGNKKDITTKDITSNTYLNADTLNITLFASSTLLNCKDTIIKQIIVSSPPQIHVIPDTVCVHNSIKLNTQEDLSIFKSFEWSSTNLTPLKTTNYSITVKDKENCIGNNTAQMIVIQEPDDSPFQDTIIIGDSITLPVDNNFGASIFKWNPEKGLSCLDCSNPGTRPLADTVYTLNITDVKGCFNKTKVFTIIVKPETHIKLPTTFTPNGDNNNDIVYVKGWGIKELISFEIYNRWGELLYKGTDINEGWNGYYKDELQNNDVYAYKVVATSWLNKEMVKEGYIHLMR